MISTFKISRKFGDFTAVNNVSLNIEENEIFGFLGLNGAGKTTFLRMICGLLRPSSGYAKFGNIEVRGPRDTQNLIPVLSYVSQEMKLYETATLSEIIPVYAGLAAASPEKGLKFAAEVDLPINRPCSKLSPGQQRKAQLTIAILKDPQYLILDEPSAGLDPKGVAEIREIIKIMQKEGKTVILSSHILGEVQSICTSVGILHQGQLHFQGPLNTSFFIEIQKDMEKAINLLEMMGFSYIPAANGVQVEVGQERIPEITSKLCSEEISLGLVEPVSLESIFNRVIREFEVKNEN